jgi:hypothetical protein
MDKITAKYENKNIVITIPADLLIFAQANRPDWQYTIFENSVDDMGNWIANHLVEFDEDQDSGNSRLYQLLDDMFDDAYERGQDWLIASGEDESFEDEE